LLLLGLCAEVTLLLWVPLCPAVTIQQYVALHLCSVHSNPTIISSCGSNITRCSSSTCCCDARKRSSLANTLLL
jgi:hypothetical protein